MSVSSLALLAALVLSVFLATLNMTYWYSLPRGDRTPLWLAGWLLAASIFAFCRLLQYAPLSDSAYRLVPRVILTSTYALAWLGYELGNSLLGYRPPPRERAVLLGLLAAALGLLWATDLIGTDQVVVRHVVFGGEFRGLQTGPLFLPASLLIWLIAAIPPFRLLRSRDPDRAERIWMASGFLFVILFNLHDYISVALNLVWVRLSDFGYLPVPLLFSMIQVRRFAGMYKSMDHNVSQRAAELSLANATLRAEMSERRQAEETSRESEARFRQLSEATFDPIVIHEKGIILEVNSAFTRTFGYDRSEVIGTSVLLFAAPESRQLVMQNVRSGYDKPYEAIGLRKDGTTFIGELIGQQIPYHGRTVRVTSIRDITERTLADEEARRNADRAAIVYATTRDLVAEHDLSTLLRTIVVRAAGMLGASSGGLYLCEPEKRQVRCVVSHNTARDFTGTVLKYGEGAAGVVAETGEPLIIDDYRVWNGRAAIYEEDQPFVSLLSVPLRWQKEILGVIHVLESRWPRVFTEDDLRMATLLANQAAAAVQNARLLESEQRGREEADAIAEIGRDISSSLQLVDVLERIAAYAKDFLAADTSAVYLPEPGATTFRASVAIGPDAEQIRLSLLTLGEGILGNIAMQKSGEIVNRAAADPRAITIEGTENAPLENLMGVPVLKKDRLVAVIAVWRTGPGLEFRSTELDFLRRLAGQVAVAIENARLFEAEQKRRREADVLAEVGRDIAETLQLDAILERLAAYARDLLRARTSAVYLYEPGAPTLRAAAVLGPSAEQIRRHSPKVGEGILGDVALRKTGEIVNDVVADPRVIHIAGTEELTFEHLAAAPVLARDRLMGLVAIWRVGEGEEFDSAELDFLNRLAGQVAVAIENANLFEDTQQRLRETQAMAHVSAVLGRTLELEPLLESILRAAVNAVAAAERGALLLADEGGNLRIHAMFGYTDPRVRESVFPPRAGYAALAFRERRAIVVPDARADDQIRYDGDVEEMLAIQSAMAAPLMVKDRAIGVIAIDNSTAKGAFGEEDLRLLTTMGGAAALAIENARLFENTRRRLSEIEAVHSVSTALRSAQTLGEALPIILDQLIELMNAGSALVDLVDPVSGEIVTELAKGVWAPMTGLRTAWNAGGSGRVVATGQPVVSRDLIADGMCAHPELVGELNSGACVPIIARHQPIGTLWVGRTAPMLPEEISLLAAIGEMAGNAIHRMRLHVQSERLLQDLEVANRQLSRAYDTTLEGWARALELRDRETEGHSRRVTDLTLALARRMGVAEPDLTHIRRGVLLHDIGKMGVTDQLLRKTGPLTDKERGQMQKHPEYAYELLRPITYLRPALDIPYCHHERWDGSGYPRGLKGKQIPLPARIFAVVDAYDALLSNRPYRKAWPRRKVLSYLREQSGQWFDPRVLEAFLGLLEDKRLNSPAS